MKIRIAVCDSDSETCAYIKEMVEKERRSAEVRAFASAGELLGSRAEFDILFLDIKGAGGMELARRLRSSEGRRHIIIFVTGYREYMEEAFDVQAFHYLVKPLDREKFLRVLERACREAELLRRQETESVLVKLRGEGSRKVLLQDIYYVESSNKYVIFHTAEGVFPVQGTMEEFEERLGAAFYRCHRCFLVNMGRITAYSQKEIQVTGGEAVLLAHKRYGAFVQAYLRYAREGGRISV